MKSPYEPTKEGLILRLHVQPGASSTGFAGTYDDRLKVRLSAKAVDGAANKSLCQFLASAFSVSKSSVTLLQGEKSREKRVLIQGQPRSLLQKVESIITAVQET